MNREITEADLRAIAIAALPSPKSFDIVRRINSYAVFFFELAHEGASGMELSIHDFLYLRVIHVPKDNFIHIDANSDLPFNHLKAIQKAADLRLVALEATEAEATDASS